MAKFTLFDPRNKKNNKHKTMSQNKDLKIKEVETFNEKYPDKLLKEVMYDDEWEDKQVIS